MNRSKGNRSCLAKLIVLVFVFEIIFFNPLGSGLLGLSSQSAYAAESVFSQNQGGYGGYNKGAYDLTAVQPTSNNWTLQSQYAAGDSPMLKWSFDVGSSILGSPLIGADGTIYFGTLNGKIFAINPDGSTIWTYATDDSLLSSGAIGTGGTLYFSSQNGNLFAINPNGTLKWVYVTGNIVKASPVIGEDGSIYIGTTEGVLFSIDINGRLNWKFSTGGIDSAVAIDKGNNIIVGSRDGNVYSVKADGTLNWKSNLETSLWSPALDKNNNIYINSVNNRFLYVLNSQGKQIGAFRLDSIAQHESVPAIGADGNLYLGADRLYKLASTGRGWVSEVYNCSTPIVGADGTLYVGTKSLSGSFYGVNKDGTRKWVFPVGGIENAPALNKDGTIYVGSRDGKLYAIDTMPLQVINSDIVNGSNNISVDKSINLFFNKEIVLAGENQYIKCYDEFVNLVELKINLNGNNITIDPDNDLLYERTYTVIVPYDTFKDSTGHLLKEDYVLKFTTESESIGSDIYQAKFFMGQNDYEINGQTKSMDAAPFLENDRTLIPVRYLGLSLGVPESEIKWDAIARTVTMSKDNITIILPVDKNLMYVNGQAKILDIVPFCKEDRIYLPARYIAEAFGYEVEWDQNEQVVLIKAPK
jgi:outer membrane protein assembly factor BamB